MARGSTGAVRVRIDAETSGLRSGVDESAKVLKTFQQGTTRAAAGARVFSDAISSISGSAQGATGAIAAMLGGFAAGGAVGVAIAAVNALVGVIKNVREEAAKAAEEARKRAKEIADAHIKSAVDVARARHVAAGGSAADFDAIRQSGEAEGALLQRQNDLLKERGRLTVQIRLAEEVIAKRLSEGVPTKTGQDRLETLRGELRQVEDLERRHNETIENIRDLGRIERGIAAGKAAGKEKTRLDGELGEYERQYREFYKVLDTRARDFERGEEERARRIAKAKADALREAQDATGYEDTSRLIIPQADVDQAAGRGADELTKKMQEAAFVGASLQDVFANVGVVFGETAGGMTAHFGKLIQQAIQLAVAMSATSGPLGWLNAAVAASALLATMASIPEQRERGGRVLAGMPYIVGEKRAEVFVPDSNGRIEPDASAVGGSGLTVQVVGAMDGQDVFRTLRREERSLARVMRRISRARRS